MSKYLLLLFVVFSGSVYSNAQMGNQNNQIIKSRYLKFDEMKFVFAPAKHNSIFYHAFTFTNTGKTITISKISTSCGCTVAKYPKTPIKKGAMAKIEVAYHSKGQVKGKFIRFVNILTTREIVRLQIEGSSN